MASIILVLSITEALAEIKTIGKRLEKKRAAILQFIARDSRLKDPLESEGGSVTYIQNERQAIHDLEERVVRIRTAIQRSNLSTTLTIEGTSRSISEWLTFRREIAEGRKKFLQTLAGGVLATREKVQKEGGRMVTMGAAASAIVTVEGAKPAFEVIVHLEEKALLDQIEMMEKVLGVLDGKLSLLNATTTIEI